MVDTLDRSSCEVYDIVYNCYIFRAISYLMIDYRKYVCTPYDVAIS